MGFEAPFREMIGPVRRVRRAGKWGEENDVEEKNPGGRGGGSHVSFGRNSGIR
jgi:hypothetical protein